MEDQKISIIVPAYNEEKSISEVLKELILLKENLNLEIIVVDDGSEDRTIENINKYDVRLIKHNTNKGKGAAIKTGIKECTGDIILIQDADMEYHPSDIPNLVNPILEDKADVVYGSRFLGEITDMSFSHKFGNKLLSFFTRLLYGFKTTDMETGYKVFRRNLLDNIDLRANSFNIEPELTSIFSKRKARFTEIPITYRYRSFGEADITWVDGVIALWYLIRLKFSKLRLIE